MPPKRPPKGSVPYKLAMGAGGAALPKLNKWANQGLFPVVTGTLKAYNQQATKLGKAGRKPFQSPWTT